LPRIGQIQVKPKIGLTFAIGLRHILRQDPDVVLVGETRDLETAEIAVRASLTGHLVFTTLHTNDAPGAILRLVDMGVEPFLLASCLRGVLAQRLVRKLCPACRREVVPALEELKFLGAHAEGMAGWRLWTPAGCAACLEGFKGRIGLFELMTIDRELQEMIRGGRVGGEALRAHAAAAGMRSLLADGVAKLLDGATSLDEVAAAASS
jgi:general secretion pathway protein E